jgi:hypothetical protein
MSELNNKELEKYLAGDETGFDSCDYGMFGSPCVFYNYDKNDIYDVDMLKIVNGNLCWHSGIGLRGPQPNDLILFEKSLIQKDGYPVFSTVDELKTLEKFIVDLNTIK